MTTMAKRRITKKATKPPEGTRTRSGRSSSYKPPLSREEMLARVPDKPYLDTPEVRHVFNDAHEVTIYNWVREGKLIAYRTNNRGASNIYKQEDVIAAIEARFSPTLAPTSRAIRETDDDEDKKAPAVSRPKKRSKKRRRTAK